MSGRLPHLNGLNEPWLIKVMLCSATCDCLSRPSGEVPAFRPGLGSQQLILQLKFNSIRQDYIRSAKERKLWLTFRSDLLTALWTLQYKFLVRVSAILALKTFECDAHQPRSLASMIRLAFWVERSFAPADVSSVVKISPRAQNRQIYQVSLHWPTIRVAEVKEELMLAIKDQHMTASKYVIVFIL